MAKADRQRFNFLTALNRQLEAAMSEGDEEYESFRTFVQGVSGEARDSQVAGTADDRLDAHAQWLAALEARMEDLEQAVELLAGEEADGPDDGLDYEDMGGDEPGVGGHVGKERRVPSNLVRTGDRPVDGRTVVASKTRVRVGDGRKPRGT